MTGLLFGSSCALQDRPGVEAGKPLPKAATRVWLWRCVGQTLQVLCLAAAEALGELQGGNWSPEGAGRITVCTMCLRIACVYSA